MKKKTSKNNLKKLSSKEISAIMRQFRGAHDPDPKAVMNKDLVKQFRKSTIATQKFLVKSHRGGVSDSHFEVQTKKMAVSQSVQSLKFQFNTRTGGLSIMSSRDGIEKKLSVSSVKRSIMGKALDEMRKSDLKIDKLLHSGKLDSKTHKLLIAEGRHKVLAKADARQAAKLKMDNVTMDIILKDDDALDEFNNDDLDSQAFADLVNNPTYYEEHKNDLKAESRRRNFVKTSRREAKEAAARSSKTPTQLTRQVKAVVKKRL